MFLDGFYLDPIYIVLFTILVVLAFLGLVYRTISKMTRLLEDIKSEHIKANTTNSGTLVRVITEPTVAIRLSSESSSHLPVVSTTEPVNSVGVNDPMDTTITMPRIRPNQ